MKNIILFSIFFHTSYVLYSQKTYHGLFVGANTTAYNNQSNFKNPKLGFNAGYNFYVPISKKVALLTGIEYNFIRYKFSRRYFCNQICLPTGSLMFENLNSSRLTIPLGIKFNLINSEKKRLYLLSGIDAILFNQVNRVTDYFLIGDSSPGTFKSSENKRFNENSAVGFCYFGGIGTEIALKNKNLNLELLFRKDISNNTFNTLENIESDGGKFNTKAVGLTLKVGYTFELDMAKLKK